MHRAGVGRKGSGAQAATVAAQSAAVAPSVVNVAGGDSAAASVQKLLNDEMKRHCRIIQEKHMIERRRPQQVYNEGGATGGRGGVAAVSAIDEEMVS